MKKNNIYKKLFLLSLTGTLALTHPKVARASKNYTRTEVSYYSVPTVTAVTNVNLREGASLNSKVLGTLYAYQSMVLCEEYNQWYKVNYGNTFAYVKKEYVIQTNQIIMQSPAIKTVLLNNSVYMYSDENFNSYVCTIPANTYVNVYLDNLNTYFIYYNNQVGYISKNNVSDIIYNNSQSVNNYDTNPIYYSQPSYDNVEYNYYYGPVNYNYYYYYDNSTNNYDTKKLHR